MFSLVFSRRFAMAHRLLADASAKCAIPHGHNEVVTVRLVATRPLPLDFARDGSATAGPLVLPEHTFAPFNAQATLFHSAAVWALYLPVTVHGRVSDIWRSYIAQRLMWDAGLLLAFDGPWVRQIRNKHNIIADLDSEMSLYLRTEALLQFLGDWRSSATITLQVLQSKPLSASS